MISRNVIRQSLKTLTPTLFLLLCSSISAIAQSPSEPQEPGEKDRTTINMNNAPVKNAINTLGKQMGLNVVFDDTIKDSRLTIMLKDVTLEQGLKIFLVAKGLQARVIEEKTIIVFPDNEANRQKYKQHELWPAKSDSNK